MHPAKKEVFYITFAIVLLLFLVKVTAVDLSNFSEQFKEKDVKIIVGEGADRSDMIGALRIAELLKADGKVVISSSAEKFQIGDDLDILELGEKLSDVTEAITSYDMKGLESGSVMTQQGITRYNQYLRLLSGNVSMYKGDIDTATMLKFERGEEVFEYEIEFENGLDSEVSSGELVDLIDEDIIFIGRDYTFTSAEKDGNEVILKLLSGDVRFSLQEGEDIEFSLDQKDYDLKVVMVSDSDSSVILEINNIRTKSLSKGEIDVVDGLRVGILNTLIDESGEIGDIAEIVLGARKLEFEDNDYTDDSFTEGGYKVNDKRISEGNIQIKGSEVNDIFSIFSIKYRLEAISDTGGDVYVGEGGSFSEEQRDSDPGINIGFEGASEVETSVIEIENSGSSEYDLVFVNAEGNKYDMPLTESDSGLVIGEKGHTLHFVETNLADNGGVAQYADFDIEAGDYFILTNRNRRGSRTHVMRYGSFDSENNEFYLDDLAIGGQTVPCQEDATYGPEVLCKVSVIAGGVTYNGYINANNSNLMIDLNGDNSINLGEARVTVKGGGIIDLGSSESPGSSFDLTLTTEASQFDEGGSPITGGAEVITITISESGSNVDADVTGGVEVFYDNVEKKYEFMSAYGVYGELRDKNEDATEIKMYYPYGQVSYKVTTSFGKGETEVTEETSYEKEIVLDKEVLVINTDSILVGGPCVNKITMGILGKDESNCDEGLEEGEAIIRIMPYSGKDVLLVYGLTKEDTKRAVDLLIKMDGKLSGSAVKLTGNVIKVDPLIL